MTSSSKNPSSIQGEGDPRRLGSFAELPTTLFGWEKTEGHALLCSFSRYDYDDAGGEPTLSSTSAHQELNYHRQEEWRRLVTSP